MDCWLCPDSHMIAHPVLWIARPFLMHFSPTFSLDFPQPSMADWSVPFDPILFKHAQEYVRACGDAMSHAQILQDCSNEIVGSPRWEEEAVELPCGLHSVSNFLCCSCHTLMTCTRPSTNYSCHTWMMTTRRRKRLPLPCLPESCWPLRTARPLHDHLMQETIGPSGMHSIRPSDSFPMRWLQLIAKPETSKTKSHWMPTQLQCANGSMTFQRASFRKLRMPQQSGISLAVWTRLSRTCKYF